MTCFRKNALVSATIVLGLGLGAQSPSYGNEPAAPSSSKKPSPVIPEALNPNSASLRGQLAEMLQSGFAATPAGQVQAAGILQSYRFNAITSTDPSTSAPTIAGAPFVGYVLQNEILPEYASTYDSQYAQAYKDNVTDINLEGIFDLFMGEIINGGLTGDLAKTGNEIGVCMAKKIKLGKSESCVLDSSDRLEKAPSKADLALMKFSCGVPVFEDVASACKVRKAIFADAKPTLIKAQKEGLIAQAFVSAYPSIFRSTLVDGVNQDQAQIGQLISSKFQSSYNPKFWTQAPLIDMDSPNAPTTLHTFAEGLRVDMRAAAVFESSSNPQLKAMAGPLFYAAANRLLVLMGGTQAQWGGSKFVPASGDAFDPKNPKKAPVFETTRFGGLTATMQNGHAATAVLDIENYSPDPGKNSTPLQIFPSTFSIGPNGVPVL